MGELKCCKTVEVKDGEHAHQKKCEHYDLKLDADKLRRSLRGVKLRDWADSVLQIHPKKQILNTGKSGTNKEHITLDPYFIDLPDDHPHAVFKNSYVVEWVLVGVTLVMARGFTTDPMSGNEMSVYAVQEIKSNNERKRPRKPKPTKKSN